MKPTRESIERPRSRPTVSGREDPRNGLPQPPPPNLAEYVAFARRHAGVPLTAIRAEKP